MAKINGKITLCCAEDKTGCQNVWVITSTEFKSKIPAERPEGYGHVIYVWEAETQCDACKTKHDVHVQAEYVGEVLVCRDTISSAEFLDQLVVTL